MTDTDRTAGVCSENVSYQSDPPLRWHMVLQVASYLYLFVLTFYLVCAVVLRLSPRDA